MKSELTNSRTAFPIVPGPTPFNRRPNGVYVGGAGNLVCKFGEGAPDVTFTAVPVGSILRISPYSIEAGTTATLLVGL